MRAIKYLVGRIPNQAVYMYFKENLAHGCLNLTISCLSNDFLDDFMFLLHVQNCVVLKSEVLF